MKTYDIVIERVGKAFLHHVFLLLSDFCPLSFLVFGPLADKRRLPVPVPSSVRQEHFLEVIQNQEFLLLPTAEIVKLLSSDEINVPDEETIFQALMMWVRYDVQNRQQDLAVLLAFIRLPLLPPQVKEWGGGAGGGG